MRAWDVNGHADKFALTIKQWVVTSERASKQASKQTSQKERKQAKKKESK
jgi:hypothetical protein